MELLYMNVIYLYFLCTGVAIFVIWSLIVTIKYTINLKKTIRQELKDGRPVKDIVIGNVFAYSLTLITYPLLVWGISRYALALPDFLQKKLETVTCTVDYITDSPDGHRAWLGGSIYCKDEKNKNYRIKIHENTSAKHGDIATVKYFKHINHGYIESLQKGDN